MFKSDPNVNDNVTIQWNEDQSVVTMTLHNTNRDSIDSYIETNLQILRNWHSPNPLYTIQNLSHEATSATLYFRERHSEITKLIKESQVNIYAAIVVKNSLSGQLLQSFARVIPNQSRYLTQRFFTNLAEAEAWIEKEKYANENT